METIGAADVTSGVVATSRRSPRQWRQLGNRGKEQFLIDVDAIRQGRESRTTLMIQNIPNKYTRQMLVDELNEEHERKRFPLLAHRLSQQVQPGLRLHQHELQMSWRCCNLRGASWAVSGEKKADVKWGRLQGKRALVEHFRMSIHQAHSPREPANMFLQQWPEAGYTGALHR